MKKTIVHSLGVNEQTEENLHNLVRAFSSIAISLTETHELSDSEEEEDEEEDVEEIQSDTSDYEFIAKSKTLNNPSNKEEDEDTGDEEESVSAVFKTSSILRHSSSVKVVDDLENLVHALHLDPINGHTDAISRRKGSKDSHESDANSYSKESSLSILEDLTENEVLEKYRKLGYILENVATSSGSNQNEKLPSLNTTRQRKLSSASDELSSPQTKRKNFAAQAGEHDDILLRDGYSSDASSTGTPKQISSPNRIRTPSELTPPPGSPQLSIGSSPTQRLRKRRKSSLIILPQDDVECYSTSWLECGKYFEFLMLVLGTWFGLPVPSWGLVCLLLCFLDEADELYLLDETRYYQTKYLVIFSFIAYSIAFIRWVKTGKYHRVYSNLKQYLSIFVMLYVGFDFGSPSKGKNIGPFFIVTWVAAESVGQVLKSFLRRIRPAARDHVRLVKIQRFVPELQIMFTKGHTAFESFPSADTIGGAVLAAVMWKAELAPFYLAFLFSTSVAFSRVYLQAHHLFDVTIGMLVGWITTVLFYDRYADEKYFTPTQAITSALSFVAFSIFLRKFKPPLPEKWKRLQHDMHGF